ncbi:MAG: hypothetical protein JSS56_16545 [Proteobacteria bacterium]|nr:hypothetical protein [Pseudomonadota bacterium]
MLSDDEFAVLNAIYLKKMATAATISEMTSQPTDQVGQQLAQAQQNEQLIALPDGAMLLPPGTQAVLDYYHQRYASIRVEPRTLQWYEAFETLNGRFIAAVTDWQRSEGDERVERKLLQCAERLAKDIGSLVPRVPRYTEYVRRFERSMDRVDQGQRDYVCKPTLDSVHNIWFEFHEDILAVLGRPRDTT